MLSNLEIVEALLNILSDGGELVPRLYLQTQLYLAKSIKPTIDAQYEPEDVCGAHGKNR